MDAEPTESIASEDDRIPCSDDLCTGILAADGVCGTCGRSSDGVQVREARQANIDDDDADDEADDDGYDHDDEDDYDSDSEPDESLDGADEVASDSQTRGSHHEDERSPCSDEMCTGILGSDGHCGTCGR